MPDKEWDFYHMDQRINDRGVRIDTELVRQAIACDLMLSDEMSRRAYALTGLENPNSVSQLKSWLETRGIEVVSLGKKDVAAMITDLDRNSCDQEALDMLSLLAGRTHQVYTGVTLVFSHGGAPVIRSFYEKTDVTFYPIDRADLLAYADSKDPLDKAGAYGIQGPFAIHVKKIHGDYNNVVGLPIARLYQELKTFPD